MTSVFSEEPGFRTPKNPFFAENPTKPFSNPTNAVVLPALKISRKNPYRTEKMGKNRASEAAFYGKNCRTPKNAIFAENPTKPSQNPIEKGPFSLFFCLRISLRSSFRTENKHKERGS
jgi:hypothetical protein